MYVRLCVYIYPHIIDTYVNKEIKVLFVLPLFAFIFQYKIILITSPAVSQVPLTISLKHL